MQQIGISSRDQVINDQQRPKFNSSEQQRSPSQHLFLNLIRNLCYIYLVMAVLSAPIIIVIVQQSLVFIASNKQKITVSQLMLSSTLLQISRNSFLASQKNLSQLKLAVSLNIQQKNLNYTLFNQQKTKQIINIFGYNVDMQNFKKIILYYDLILQIVLVLSSGFLQYKSYYQKKIGEMRYVQNYSIEVSNIPNYPIYQLLTKMNQIIIQYMSQKNQQCQFQILDIQPAYSEIQIKYRLQLQNHKILINKWNQFRQLNNCKQIQNLKKKIKQSKLKIKHFQILFKHQREKQNVKVIWVTFFTLKQRQIALKVFNNNFICSKNNLNQLSLRVTKAPSPQQIIQSNWYLHPLKRYGIRIIIFIIVISSILVFDTLILFIEKYFMLPLLTTGLIILLEIILKIIIIQLSQFEMHQLRSRMDLSTFRKLTFFLYINSGLLIFISSYNFQCQWICNWFSRCQYSQLNQQWYYHIGFSIYLTFFIQIFFINFRLYWDYFKSIIIQFIVRYFTKFMTLSRYQRQFIKLKVDLDIIYGHLMSSILIANTYSYTHPIFYLLTCFLLLVTYIAHNKYIIYYTRSAPYNNDKLDDAAIKIFFKSILLHLLFVSYTQSFKPSFILFITLLSIYLVREFLLRHISRLFRLLNGPIFKYHPQNRKTQTNILEIMTPQNVQQKKSQIIRRIQQVNQLLTNQNYNKNYLQKYLKILLNRINNLDKIKITSNSVGLKGKISYFIQPNSQNQQLNFDQQIIKENALKS